MDRYSRIRLNPRRGPVFGLAFALAVAMLTVPGRAQTVTHTEDGVPTTAHVIIPQSRSFAPTASQPAGIAIESVQAKVEVHEMAASTTVQVHLRNNSTTQQEAVLLLPIVHEAAVSAFSYEGAASEPTAQVLLADEARRVYDGIVARVLDPALLEFAGYNLIRSSVFPVPAGGTQTVRVTYDHILESDGNRIDYVLPRSESLVRRHPWSIDATINNSAPISMVYSPSHGVDSQRHGASRVDVSLSAAGETQPGAFRLSWLLEREGISASVLAYPDPSIGGGYFLMMAGLPADVDLATRSLKREVTIVIDRSGSMTGGKLEQVSAAAWQVIDGLTDGESFNIIDYATSVSLFAPGPVVKDSDSASSAKQYLSRLRPAGGTNIHDALLEALRQPATEDTLPIVLFLTDGLPTIGRTTEVQIRAMVAQANTHNRRIFTLGVGEDVNVPLLDKVADLTRATATFILPGESVEHKVAGVFKRLYGPVLSDPTMVVHDTDGSISTRRMQELIPDRLPDLFDGDHMIVLGQYYGEAPVTVSLSGNYLGTDREFQFFFDFEKASTRHAYVPRLWASRRIAYLIDEIRQAGAESAATPAMMVGATLMDDPRTAELIDEILRLSTRFGILTEYTAFLATEGTDLTDWNKMQMGCGSEIDTKAVRTRSGLAALNQSLNFASQKGQVCLNHDNAYVDENLNRVSISAVQQMNDRAFFQSNGRWVDSELIVRQAEITPTRTIAIGSEEFFKLLHRLVTENRQGVLSLAGETILMIDDEIVLFKPAAEMMDDGC